MATSTETFLGRAALIVGHAAGMLDLVAAPVWVGVLIQFRHLSPLQAGLLMTVYTAGVFLTSIALAPRFMRLQPRLIAIGGFVFGALAFLAIVLLNGFAALVPAHFAAGIGAGSALSMVHGTISRSARPHRLFAIANLGVALFSIAFFVVIPRAVQHDPNTVFLVLGGLLTLAGLAAVVAFPSAPIRSAAAETARTVASGAGSNPYRVAVALAFCGVALMSIGQSETYSFLERIGVWRDFPADNIGNVLAISGFLNVLAPIIAAFLENAVPRIATICVALFIHAAFVVTASNSAGFAPYAVAGSLLIFMTIFEHTFMFGVIAKLDPTGRTASSTPAMITLGAMIGPALGGAVVQFIGFFAVGWVSAVMLIASVVCFLVIRSLRVPTLEANKLKQAQPA